MGENYLDHVVINVKDDMDLAQLVFFKPWVYLNAKGISYSRFNKSPDDVW